MITAEHADAIPSVDVQRMLQEYAKSPTVETLRRLAQQHEITPKAADKFIMCERFRELCQRRGSYLDNPQFADAFAAPDRTLHRALLGPMPEADEPLDVLCAPADERDPYIRRLYNVPLLNRNQERHLFLKYNYLKYIEGFLLDRIDPELPHWSKMDEVEVHASEAKSVRNAILEANLRLVVSVAKRFATSQCPLDELISDGNMYLLRIIDCFDADRGNKFSTYATMGLMRNYTRDMGRESKRRTRFPCDQPLLADQTDRRGNSLLERAQSIRECVMRILEKLPPREREILERRYLGDNAITYKAMAPGFGVTAARTRQIGLRALKLLAQALLDDGIDISAFAPDDDRTEPPQDFNHRVTAPVNADHMLQVETVAVLTGEKNVQTILQLLARFGSCTTEQIYNILLYEGAPLPGIPGTLRMMLRKGFIDRTAPKTYKLNSAMLGRIASCRDLPVAVPERVALHVVRAHAAYKRAHAPPP